MTKPPTSISFSHVGIYVKDVERMADFYKRMLGFVETDRGVVRGNPIIFLSSDPNEHHQIVLAEGRTDDLDQLVLNQISLRVESLQDLREIRELIADDPEVTDINPISHGNAWSIYFRDPELNRIEVFVDTPWYVEQPMLEPLDLSLSDDEIHDNTHTAIKGNPGFQPIEDWKAKLREQIAEARAGSA